MNSSPLLREQERHATLPRLLHSLLEIVSAYGVVWSSSRLLRDEGLSGDVNSLRIHALAPRAHPIHRGGLCKLAWADSVGTTVLAATFGCGAPAQDCWHFGFCARWCVHFRHWGWWGSDRRVLASRYRLAQPRSTVYIQYGIETYSSKIPRLTSLAYSFLLSSMSFSSNSIAGCIHGRCFSSTRRDSNGSGYSPKSTTLATVRQLGNPTACISSLWGLGPRTICSAWGWSSLWRSQISNSNCAPNFFYKATWSASTFFIVIRHDLFVCPSHNCVNHYK